MTARREPYLPLFVGDFLAATGEWTGEEQSLYLLLLAHAWSLGSLPTDEERLARLSKWNPKTFAKLWPTVQGKFFEQDGRLFNARLEEHRQHSRVISERRAIAGANGAAKTNGKPAAIAEVLPDQTEPASINQSSKSERKKPTPRQKSALIPLPGDFTLTAEIRVYALAELPDCDPEALFAKFCDQARAKDWRYASWTAALQTYIRNAKADSAHFSAGQYPRRTNGGIHAGVVMR